jgi:hypothetical protein
MSKFKEGDFVLLPNQDENNPFIYRVVNIPELDGACEAGGLTLVARFYRTEILKKVKEGK